MPLTILLTDIARIQDLLDEHGPYLGGLRALAEGRPVTYYNGTQITGFLLAGLEERGWAWDGRITPAGLEAYSSIPWRSLQLINATRRPRCPLGGPV